MIQMLINQKSLIERMLINVLGMCDRSSDTVVPDTLQWLILSPISSWTLVVMFAVAFVHFLSGFCKSTKIRSVMYNRNSTLSRHINSTVTKTSAYYQAPIWSISPYFHTLIAPFLLNDPYVQFKRDYLQLNDLGVIAMDWFCPTPVKRGRKGAQNVQHEIKLRRSTTIKKCKYIMIVIPDINSDCFSVTHAAYEASKRGFCVVVFNRRGHGGSVLTTPKLQPYGDTGDLRQLVKYFKERYTRQEMVALGFGAGSDLLMSYLGEYGSSSYLRATVAISPLYDPQTNLFDLDQSAVGFSKPLHFMQLLKEKLLLLRHSASLQKSINVYDALRSSSFKDLYRNCYYSFSDCSSDEQFWEKNNPLRDVDDIASPVLCISSLDDPFCAPEAIPYDLFSLYPNMCLVTTEVGGHCAFIESCETSGRWSSWAVSLALEYIQSVVAFSPD